jgi:hypothetical protein
MGGLHPAFRAGRPAFGPSCCGPRRLDRGLITLSRCVVSRQAGRAGHHSGRRCWDHVRQSADCGPARAADRIVAACWRQARATGRSLSIRTCRRHRHRERYHSIDRRAQARNAAARRRSDVLIHVDRQHDSTKTIGEADERPSDPGTSGPTIGKVRGGHIDSDPPERRSGHRRTR